MQLPWLKDNLFQRMWVALKKAVVVWLVALKKAVGVGPMVVRPGILQSPLQSLTCPPTLSLLYRPPSQSSTHPSGQLA